MKKRISIVLLLCLLLVTGCSKTQNNEEMTQQVATLTEEKKALEQKITELESTIETLQKENEVLKSAESNTDETYKVYSRDENSWEIVQLGEVQVGASEALSLQEKLQKLADNLSQDCFQGLPIKVEGIETIGNDQIAKISLIEPEDTSKISWMGIYFQGSAGAGITETALEETFLQKDLTTPWIDGIEILYNGEPLLTDHLDFREIRYR